MPEKRLAAYLAAYKLGLLLFIAVLPWLPFGPFNAGSFAANFHWPPGAAPSWSALFKTWDAQHFLYLSRYGYQPRGLSNNFYPLWPWLIRAGTFLCAGRALAAGLVLSNLFSLAAIVLFYGYIREARDEKTAAYAVLCLLAYPGAFFLSLPYSESVFFLLVMTFFWGLRRERPGLAGLCAFLLPLSRPQGILVAVPFWYWLCSRKRTKLPDLGFWLCPLAGAAVYLLFMQYAAGDAFEGFKAYNDLFPGARSVARLWDLPGFIAAFFNVTAWHGTSGSLMERLWFVLFAGCLPALWKRDRLLFLYALPMGLVPAVTLSFISYTRHLLLVFPVFIVLAEHLNRRGNALRWTLLSAAWILQIILLTMHANNYWVA